ASPPRRPRAGTSPCSPGPGSSPTAWRPSRPPADRPPPAPPRAARRDRRDRPRTIGATMGNPPAAYRASAGGALDVDRAFYTRLAEEGGRETVESLAVPSRCGRAWQVHGGHQRRSSTPEGPPA